MNFTLAQAIDQEQLRTTIDTLARTPLSQVVSFVAACTIVRLLAYWVSLRAKTDSGGSNKIAHFSGELMDAVIYAGVFVFMLIRPFAVQTFVIPTGSMLDTLQLNDYIIANKGIYRYSDPQFGDIVVFKPPKEALRPGDGEIDFIKRCRGVPGDLIEIKDGVLYRNGQPVDEPFLKLEPGFDRMLRDFKLVNLDGRYIPVTIMGSIANPPASGHSAPAYEAQTDQEMQTLLNLPAERIPAGYYLMMGDNREYSYDGRAWGLVPRENIIGKSMCVWLPVKRWQITR